MIDAEVLARAKAVQSHWGGRGDPALIGNRENAVFKVEASNGRKIALRLHRKGYQTRAYIEGELTWTQALSDMGFACPTPISTQSGERVVCLEDGQMATAINWIDAAPVAEFSGTAEAHADLYFKIGKLLRQLHRLTDQIADDIQRPSWNKDALLGHDPSWGRFWENPSLSENEVAIVQSARKNAAQHLDSLKALDFGLIHADAIQENVLVNDRLHLIDYDDGGYGYRLYELGIALIQHHQSPHLDLLTNAICEGYETPTEHIAFFTMLRSMASAGWIISRADPSSPAHRIYAERMLHCIELYKRG